MGYPNFGKVKTITLPYEEDMTASQYLDRYGIDLATIELYDLINIALDDVVYPVLYIDKENKVLFMADRAYSYDGGLTAVNNSLINAVIATGTVTNAKPIYCHPINFEHIEGNVSTAKITCLIFNNSATVFDKEGFVDFIDELHSSVGDTIRIMASGGFKSENSVAVISYLGKDGANYYMLGVNSADATEIFAQFNRSDFLSYITSLNDGVNKIN